MMISRYDHVPQNKSGNTLAVCVRKVWAGIPLRANAGANAGSMQNAVT